MAERARVQDTSYIIATNPDTASVRRTSPTDVGWTDLTLFFFQAEDGIRGGTVTGVQTCALPISRAVCAKRLRRGRRARHAWRSHTPNCAFHSQTLRRLRTARGNRPRWYGCCLQGQRSEERRVGKECRSRWSP